MIKKFLIERMSWIIFFIVLQFFIIFIGFMDSTLPVLSLLYIVFLSSIGFILFLIVRYQKETNFYRRLEDWEPLDDVSPIPNSSSPLEAIVEKNLTEQTEHYKREMSQNITHVEQEKDDLLSWIHEIKTPLTAMQLMMERVEQEDLKSQLQYEWLRVHLLLDQQLHQKRMPFLNHDLYIERTNLESVIFQEIKGLKTWCMQRKIGFDVSLHVTHILTDAKWFSFILRQLITNAVKYSEASDIDIESYTKKGLTTLSIRDYGRGIDPRDLQRIFDKGFTSTRHHNDSASTGMGLYLTKKVAESLKIKIEVQSKRDEGTTFTLTFPKKNAFVDITSM
ncbi:two-component system, OmpR family, bacitracin resistance sensor histidine kinase BceS [Oceanobacillus limi]|uniref:histidine kinase n=1 Tax=Oceanobacillus limi TaxID=930131 RepID=A0A1I0CSU3_9BACI|nr:sensor histidine kinase [Oceanobacillus limi]SET22728.1 two-component system, OmpR family, bacitracin resistance sensor histidine kinase BceS [Oceanobacillus limi]